MTRRQYDAATAKALLESAFRGYGSEDSLPYSARDDGMYANEGHREVFPPGTVFDWTPADDMDWLGSPNPDTAPFLPIPFTANELAACMLEGVGRGIGDVLEKRIGEPLDTGALDAHQFNPRYRWARDALEEAYALAAAAQLVVGEFDHDEEARADALTKQFQEANARANIREGLDTADMTHDEHNVRRALAKASVADLRAQMKQAQARAASNWEVWRKAMVRELLRPKETGTTGIVPTPAPDSARNSPAQRAAKRRTWREVTEKYIVDVIRNGQYATAKELFAALEKKAGDGSPFDRGIGGNRGSLFVREISQTVSLKTLGNKFAELRRIARDAES